MSALYEFLHTVKGIPCLVQITGFYGGCEGTYWEPPEHPTADVQICDRRGRHAPWLERKMNEQDWRDVECQAVTEYLSSCLEE